MRGTFNTQISWNSAKSSNSAAMLGHPLQVSEAGVWGEGYHGICVSLSESLGVGRSRLFFLVVTFGQKRQWRCNPETVFAVPGISAFRLNACWSTIKSAFDWVKHRFLADFGGNQFRFWRLGAPPVQMCMVSGKTFARTYSQQSRQPVFQEDPDLAAWLNLGCQGSCPF